MSRYASIISFVLIFAMVFSFAAFPVHAIGWEGVAAKFGEWLLTYVAAEAADALLGDYIRDNVSNSPASKAFQTLFNNNRSVSGCEHSWTNQRVGMKNGKLYYYCSICSKQTEADVDEFNDAYSDYVNDLPATGYNSAGHLIWRPLFEDLDFESSYMGFSYSRYGRSDVYASNLPYSFSGTGWTVNISYNSSLNCIDCLASGTDYAAFTYWFYFYAPVSGTFIRLNTMRYDVGGNYGYFDSSRFLGSFGSSFYDGNGTTSFNASSSLLFRMYFPAYEIIPTTSIDTIYNINTRASTITGDVYYYDVNGDMQIYNKCTIVNETNNTYYNPVTNMTYEFKDWTYDYTDRSYTCNCEDDTTTVITFSDDCIIIQEGEDTYYVYYGTGSGAPETHTHEWYQTGRKDATCTDYGTITYTCSTCNEQKTDILPALGHDWVQSGFVPAEFDDVGQLLDKAYVLYVCSRCKEEFRDYDGVGPPDDGGGGAGDNDNSGLLAWLQDFKQWLGDKLDALTGGGGDTVIENDYDITYTDEDGNEKKKSVKGILATFGWWKDVANIGREMFSQISAAEVAAYAYDANAPGSNPTGAPSIPVTLSAAQSNYGVVYGEDMEMLDLSWYTPYKATVDQLVSGFLWLAFGLAVFRHAPAIISGVGLSDFGGITEGQLALTDGKEKRRR